MQNNQGPKVIIVGGGIGGLTAAIGMRRAGIDATVYERAADLRQIRVGGGIHLWTNAMRMVQKLDLAEQVEAVGTRAERQEFYSWRGRQLCNWPVGDLGRRLGAPTVGVARADVHGVLANALEDGVLQLGAECTGFVEDQSGVTAQFADGREERGDVLVGADGINSVVRSFLLGPSPRRYAGYTIWQAILDFEHENVPLGVFRMLWGPGLKFTIYHVGGGRLYWFAVANAPEGGREIDKSELLRRYHGFMEPTEAIIAATDQSAITRMDHYDRPPVKRWGRGRVTLLGDAAHPMTLNLGQGACQTVEDAVMLTKCLREERDVETALRSYEAQRIKRTTSIVNLAWRLGVMGRWENPVACGARDLLLKATFDGFVWKQHSKTMAYDIDLTLGHSGVGVGSPELV